jgi:CDGSH-type Zn-finger protein
MSDPVIAAKEPFSIEVRAGKKYFWCSCGKSAKQPFCDGSHSGSAFTPEMYEADKDRTVFFCGCKHSKRAPLCDGSHAKL